MCFTVWGLGFWGLPMSWPSFVRALEYDKVQATMSYRIKHERDEEPCIQGL